MAVSSTRRLWSGTSFSARRRVSIGLASRLTTARQALGEAKFAAEFEAGKRLSRGEAVRFALEEREDHEAVSSPAIDTGPLAKREFEVARLVAEGLSNKQIAERLIISERTAATHVGHILDKLGFNSRAQIAAWLPPEPQGK